MVNKNNRHVIEGLGWELSVWQRSDEKKIFLMAKHTIEGMAAAVEMDACEVGKALRELADKVDSWFPQ